MTEEEENKPEMQKENIYLFNIFIYLFNIFIYLYNIFISYICALFICSFYAGEDPSNTTVVNQIKKNLSNAKTMV